MSAGAIPWFAIVDYGDRVGLDAEENEALVEIIRAMDVAWLDWQEKNRKAGETSRRLDQRHKAGETP